MAAAPCLECKRRPKALPRQRCTVCLLRHEPIGEQVKAARQRLAMVPPELRRKRTVAMADQAPTGTDWCAGCQSYRDAEDFRHSAATRHTQCYACRSAKSHAAMSKRVYGIDGEQYEALLELQGGGCAVCGAKPRAKRLAIDHDHGTGAVRGLLCKRHNKDALGALHDSIAQVAALWHYLNTPPASGDWAPIAEQAPLVPSETGAARPSKPVEKFAGIVTPGGQNLTGGDSAGLTEAETAGLRGIPVGSIPMPGKRGLWLVWSEPGSDSPF